MNFTTRTILLLVVVSLGWVTSAAWADSPPPYKIGVILPLSGNVASLGNYVKKGIDLAYESLPEQTQSQITLLYEDDEFDPAKTVTAYRKLMGAGGIDAAFVLGSPPANALGPITEKEKKILIAIGASDPTITAGKTYSFIHWVIPPVLGNALANEIVRRKFQRIGFVGAEASGTLADIEAAVSALKDRGVADRVVYRQSFLKDETDYRTAVQQLRDKHVDLVVAVLFPGALSSFAKQFRNAKIPAELAGMETFEDEGEVKAASGALEGAWYVNASDSAEWFGKTYSARYGEQPGWGAANAYDSLRLIAAAIAQGKRTSDELKHSLRAVADYDGATGKFSASGDNRFTLPAAMKKISEGKFQNIPAAESQGAHEVPHP